MMAVQEANLHGPQSIQRKSGWIWLYGGMANGCSVAERPPRKQEPLPKRGAVS
jgi:hypothetical protein